MQILWFCAPVLAMATEADSMPGATWDGGFVQGQTWLPAAPMHALSGQAWGPQHVAPTRVRLDGVVHVVVGVGRRGDPGPRVLRPSLKRAVGTVASSAPSGLGNHPSSDRVYRHGLGMDAGVHFGHVGRLGKGANVWRPWSWTSDGRPIGVASNGAMPVVDRVLQRPRTRVPIRHQSEGMSHHAGMMGWRWLAEG